MWYEISDAHFRPKSKDVNDLFVFLGYAEKWETELKYSSIRVFAHAEANGPPNAAGYSSTAPTAVPFPEAGRQRQTD